MHRVRHWRWAAAAALPLLLLAARAAAGRDVPQAGCDGAAGGSMQERFCSMTPGPGRPLMRVRIDGDEAPFYTVSRADAEYVTLLTRGMPTGNQVIVPYTAIRTIRYGAPTALLLQLH